ncbi:hypothetical protein HK097_005828 [Rhizophlyctis rosea]|uniref:Fcf2 pre-rRNA processing C-terminal domain-containing protein n=1 Tax=Rhizophlyctis rosea TaxID=64517 RepID=A0AAD5SEQ0_9FUNG|nr:hypothetical protein HK097_005828 [Rhizophlyctis rosea]
MPKAQKDKTRPSLLTAEDRLTRGSATAPDDDIDLDDLLSRATQALKERQEAVISIASQKSPLETVHLDAGTNVASYLSADSPFTPVRLNTAKLVKTTDNSNALDKGGLGISKHGDRTLVAEKPAETIAPELDYDRKQKEKMAKAQETAGPKWFDLPAPEMTEEVKRDLHILQSRGVLDPKRHYKKDTTKGLPKFFQIGTIVEGAADFYSGRLTRKERKEHIIDELMADHDSRRYFKQKAEGIREAKGRVTRKGYKIKKRR